MILGFSVPLEVQISFGRCDGGSICLFRMSDSKIYSNLSVELHRIRKYYAAYSFITNELLQERFMKFGMTLNYNYIL